MKYCTQVYKMSDGFLDTVYSGVATFGIIYSTISAIVATLIAVGLLIFGIYVLYNNFHLTQVDGVADDASVCTGGGPNGAESCTTLITYVVAGKTYAGSFNGYTTYPKGATVPVFYNPSNPNDSEIERFPMWAGWAMIVGAVFVAVLPWVWVYFARAYKPFAALTGVVDLVSLFTPVLIKL